MAVDRPAAVGSGVYDCTYTAPDGTTLDSEYADCDDLVTDMAHKEGLPPQFIKAEIWEESYKHSFQKDSFRYEPNFDKRYISKRTLEKYNNSKSIWEPKSTSTYFTYLFRAASDSNLTTAEIHPRHIYYATLSNGKIGYVPDNFETSFGKNTYVPLSTLNLVNADDSLDDVENWFNTDTRFPDSSYNFVAQTAVASSYGMMQMMYTTAVEKMGYKSNNKDPLGLTRPLINVGLGTGFLAIQYKTINNEVGQNTTSFLSFKDYAQALKYASAGYKGGAAYTAADKVDYSIVVLNQSKVYWITDLPEIGQ